MEVAAFILLVVLTAGVVAVARLLRHIKAALVTTAARLHMLQVELANLHQPIGDVKRKQEEVLCEVTKYRDSVTQLLKDIRDLNNTELTDRQEILSRTNITGSSRITNMRSWMAKLEDAAEKELLGLGGER